MRTALDASPGRGAVDTVVEDPFEQPGPTQARRRALRVIACGRTCLLWRTGDDFTTLLCVRREHAMVWVMFEEGDADRPVWIGMLPA
jgi:hypothetical protein